MLATSGWIGRFIILAFLGLAAGLPRAEAAPPDSPPMIAVAFGEIGIADDVRDPYQVGIDYYFRPFGQWRLVPAIGIVAVENGARFVHADLRRDFRLAGHWLLTPSFGAGYFKDAEDFSLGKALEFRSGIEIAYQFRQEWRLGLGLFHLSNGGLGRRNPGTEALLLSLGIPLR